MGKNVTDKNLVAYCGLYCGACKMYLKEKCPGCRLNEKASWCKARSCCIEHEYASCADCNDFADPMLCKDFNNFMSKFFGFIFRSDREACISQIKELGLDGHAINMAETGRQTIKK